MNTQNAAMTDGGEGKDKNPVKGDVYAENRKGRVIPVVDNPLELGSKHELVAIDHDDGDPQG